MIDLLQSAFVEALGWSLVDSLWQTGALWGVYSLVTLNGKKFTSAARHNLALLSVLAATAWFLVSLLVNYNSLLHHRQLYSIAYLLNGGSFGAVEKPLLVDSVVSVLSTLYVAGLFIYSAGLVIQSIFTNNLYRKSFAAAPALLTNKVEQLASKINLKKSVSVWVSAKASSPAASGILKPIILFPLAAVNQLTTAQMEAVLMHELFHVKRRDYLLNLALVFADVVLFFNPFARLLSTAVRRERENSCDDQVLAFGYDAWEYSQALYLLGMNANKATFAIAATGDNKKLLLARIKRMLKLATPSPSFAKPLFAFFLCLAVAAFSGKHRSNIPVLQNTTEAVVEKAVYIAPPQLMPPAATVYEETRIEKELNGKTEVRIKKKVEQITAQDKSGDNQEQPDQELVEDVLYDINTLPVFVNENEDLDFTIIVPETPEKPLIITKECPAPFVPASTFYCPVDSFPAPKITIVHI